MNRAEEMAARLDTCADEPIHIPGSIQRHGFLLLLDSRGERVLAASENAEEFLALPVRLILGAPVDTVLEREILGALRSLTVTEDTNGLTTYLGAFQLRNELYSLITHRASGARMLEFERVDRLVSPELMNAVITNFVGKLSKLDSEVELCQAITRQVKDLTGFSRVLLYSFDEAGHGTVLCEENDGTLPSFLGLRFPATDIPAQARELYVLNSVRIIPDAQYTPSPLRSSASRAWNPASLDLSLSVLRSVSPIHLEYMRNMGTQASMSISILCEGKLWGLISCHNETPRTVPYLVRSASDLLTRMVGTQLTSLRTARNLRRMVHFHAIQRAILTQMAAENDYVGAMTAQLGSLAQITDAEGVALIMDGRCELAGQTPEAGEVLRLVEWMNSMPGREVFESRELGKELAWAQALSEVASGLLAIRISNVRQGYILWFRSELVRTVAWAGKRAQEADGSPSDDQDHSSLRPRTSFNAWKELVRGQSAPWSEMEVESAREFRAAVVTINLRRAEEAAELSEARFRQLTHALPNLVWTATDNGQLTYVNQGWRTEGLGATGCWFEQARVLKEDRPRCREQWAAAVANGTTFEAEVRFCRPTDNAERWHLVRAVPFLRSDSTRAGWVGTCTDLTDRRERERALGMTEKLALTGRMTSVIAHEINNPLEAITNLLFLVRGELSGDGPARGYISMAESELQRISGITRQTLRWSRESAQKAEHGFVGALFDDVLRLYAGKIRNREVTVTVRSGANVPFYGVVSQLQQVLANLLSNAVDAVPVGGRVWLSASAVDGTLEIAVGDHGAGMSAEVREQLFQPFFSTKGDLGNGLGLYISKEIVETHDGKLIVDSVPGKGTEVRILLPVRQTVHPD